MGMAGLGLLGGEAAKYELRGRCVMDRRDGELSGDRMDIVCVAKVMYALRSSVKQCL